MTRMIERWFPCAEVSTASKGGWGSGKSEKALFTWFAARPLAQAKAAVLTSLLPWPEGPAEQHRLQGLVREAMSDRDGAWRKIVDELSQHYPDSPRVVDPFSGRAMIPLEAARLGAAAWGIDNAPVATVAGQLLADYPLRKWDHEPPLPFTSSTPAVLGDRLVEDTRVFLEEVGRRYVETMQPFYPAHNGRQPWGYLWAVTLPCQECGHRFPLTGSLALRHPLVKKHDPGQSYRITADRSTGQFTIDVHSGAPTGTPTLVTPPGRSKQSGKVAVCPFCHHVHQKETHARLAGAGMGEDALLVAADIDDHVGKAFRLPTPAEHEAAKLAAKSLSEEAPFAPGLPAVPDEPIPPGNNDTVRPSKYGAKTYGDLCNARQTLGFVRLCRVIDTAACDLVNAGLSPAYAAAMAGYATSVLVRKIKRSTRGASLNSHRRETSNRIDCDHIFTNEASIGFSYDHFETGLGDGPGTWPSLSGHTLAVLVNQAARPGGRPATLQSGSATAMPLPASSMDAVVTDPPYDSMIDYADASDLFYAWMKRALANTHPEFGITADPNGLQDKHEEVIVKRGGTSTRDHRNRVHYDAQITAAFAESRRVVKHDGVVALVFGHGDIEVWNRLLTAVSDAGLYLTGSWPAQTESGGKAGSANIVTTLTMSCRPAPEGRTPGRVNEVDAEVRREIRDRITLWEQADLATHDQLMAAVGPAMEVVGRYSEVLDRRGQPVPLERYLVLARKAVREAQDVKIDGLPLDTFDARTRFALDWVRMYGRAVAPASEARWQALATDIDYADVAGSVLRKAKVKGADGVRLAASSEATGAVGESSALIDVVFAVAAAMDEGLAAVGDVLGAAGLDADDSHLWAAIGYLADRLPEADADQQAWTRLVRGRTGVTAAARTSARDRVRSDEDRAAREAQGRLFGSDQQEMLDRPQRRLDEGNDR